jgi:hypothetical protein
MFTFKKKIYREGVGRWKDLQFYLTGSFIVLPIMAGTAQFLPDVFRHILGVLIAVANITAVIIDLKVDLGERIADAAMATKGYGMLCAQIMFFECQKQIIGTGNTDVVALIDKMQIVVDLIEGSIDHPEDTAIQSDDDRRSRRIDDEDIVFHRRQMASDYLPGDLPELTEVDEQPAQSDVLRSSVGSRDVDKMDTLSINQGVSDLPSKVSNGEGILQTQDLDKGPSLWTPADAEETNVDESVHAGKAPQNTAWKPHPFGTTQPDYAFDSGLKNASPNPPQEPCAILDAFMLGMKAGPESSII